MISIESCYLAGSWADRARLRGVRAELAALGVACTSRWLDNDDELEEGLPEWAMRDRADLITADTLILFTEVPSTAGGMWTEYGLALGLHKAVIGVGPQTNLFCCLADFWFPTLSDLLGQIAPREVRV